MASHIRPITVESDFLREHLHDKARLVLRSDLRLRREPRFISFWRLGDDGSAYDVIHIHPSAAVMVSLFDGQRTVGQVVEALSYAIGVSKEQARQSIIDFIARHSDALIPGDSIAQAARRRYDPRSFVIPSADVDLSARRPGAPLSLVYSVTNDCVADCIYCYAERQRHGKGGPPLALPRVLEIVEEIAELQVPSVLVSGGDPFLHPHIVGILAAMIRRGIHVPISTKGELSEQLIGGLAEVGLNRLQVSIDTTNEPTHRMLTRRPGLLGKTLATVKRAKAAGFRVLVNVVLTNQNVSELRQTVEALVPLGITSISFTEYTPSLYRHSDGLLVSPSQRTEVDETVQELQTRYPEIPIESRREQDLPFEERAICTGGLHQLAFYPDGKVVLCDQAPSIGPCVIGDLSQQSLKEIWDSERLALFLHPDRSRFRGTPCETCEDFDECHTGRGRCFIKALKAYGRAFAPTPECPRAPLPQARLRPSSTDPSLGDRAASTV
jgi:radical SAM protein with 4Fe4S-binding SPASM domain